MRKQLTYIFLLLSALFLNACSFDKFPIDKLDPKTFFQSENDLVIYCNSFYDMLPTGDEIITTDQKISDYMATASGINNFIYGNYSSLEQELEQWWTWDELRNVNYFLENNVNENIPPEIRERYNGLARFFRAWFYYHKVRTFGNVPWYDKVLSSTDPDLYKPQDSRVLVMKKIVEDLDFAIGKLPVAASKDASTITRWTALAFKSRVCLFEGTYRKYASDPALSASATEYLQYAQTAAETLIKESPYTLYNTGSTPYRDLFTSTATIATEVILADTYSDKLTRYNSANWLFTSSSYGARPGLTKTFVNTFLNRDGTRFTEKAGYEKITFPAETAERDKRLSQVIRTPGYKLLGKDEAPDFGHMKTGYHLIKFTQDENANLAMAKNTNCIPIIRYAEVLLNYAEATAELGRMDDKIWGLTIGKLRDRGGITAGQRSAAPDPYMQSLYPEITSADILEIRRERGIELVGEGFRFDDLRRWRAGHLLTREWDGMYVAQLEIPLDMNGDGAPDVCFTPAAPENPAKGVFYYVFSEAFGIESQTAGGKLRIYPNAAKKFEDKKYLYPVPESARLKNPALNQNPQW